MQTDDPADYLKRLGAAGAGPHDIAEAALMLAAFDHPVESRESYRAHLAEIAQTVQAEARLARTAEEAAQAVCAVMAGRFGYDGDRRTYDDPRNGDLMAVIDRRRGLPVALGILYIHAARAAGCEAHGLNTPGHFLMAVVRGGRAIVLDPFNGGALIDRDMFATPPRMGIMLPGDSQPDVAVSDADVLLRLQNNLKLRALQAGACARALEIAKRMVLIGPRRGELWLDLARLYEETGALGAAKGAYETCLSLKEVASPLHNEAALGLHALKRRLN